MGTTFNIYHGFENCSLHLLEAGKNLQCELTWDFPAGIAVAYRVEQALQNPACKAFCMETLFSDLESQIK